MSLVLYYYRYVLYYFNYILLYSSLFKPIISLRACRACILPGGYYYKKKKNLVLCAFVENPVDIGFFLCVVRVNPAGLSTCILYSILMTNDKATFAGLHCVSLSRTEILIFTPLVVAFFFLVSIMFSVRIL